MEYYVGLDVSLKQTHVCVMRSDRSIAWQGVVDTHVGMLAETLERFGNEVKLVGLETGSLTPWLYHGLKEGACRWCAWTRVVRRTR